MKKKPPTKRNVAHNPQSLGGHPSSPSFTKLLHWEVYSPPEHVALLDVGNKSGKDPLMAVGAIDL